MIKEKNFFLLIKEKDPLPETASKLEGYSTDFTSTV